MSGTRPDAARRRPLLGKARAVLLVLILSGGLFLVATRVWLTTSVPSPVGPAQSVEVTGSEASAVLLAVALAGLAAGLFLSIARKIGRIVAVVILLGVSAAWIGATAQVLGSPEAAVAGKVRTATGLDSVSGDVAVNAWPIVGLVLAGLLVLAAALIVVAGRGWRTSARYERPAPGGAPAADGERPADEELDPAASWDAQTRGDDPS